MQNFHLTVSVTAAIPSIHDLIKSNLAGQWAADKQNAPGCCEIGWSRWSKSSSSHQGGESPLTKRANAGDGKALRSLNRSSNLFNSLSRLGGGVPSGKGMRKLWIFPKI